MQMRKIHPSELGWANEHYSSINFALSTETDFIVVAEIDGVKAGLGRLTQVGARSAEMGGIYVLPKFRGQSIAAEIVEFLLKHSEFPTLFCVPFAHLDMFYRRFGFLPIDQTVSVPEKIGNKIKWCENRYDSPVVLLYRNGAAYSG